MSIIKHRKIFYFIAILLAGASIASLFTWGLKPGIDFTGGSLINVAFSGELPLVENVSNFLKQSGFEGASVRMADSDGYIIRLQEINQSEKDDILQGLSFGGQYQPIEKEFSTIGPILGKEAIYKSYISIILVLLAIIIFITFAFRKVSKPISSSVYGGLALVALAHDIIIPTGVFSVLGYTNGVEVDTLFVTALLVILGFSVHDTIVVFDRVRENLKNNNERGSKEEFDSVVGRSISETFTRSINTSLTTLLAVIVLYVWGPETTRHFALAMGIGLIAGAYSSIFIGSPLLVTIHKLKTRKGVKA